MLQSERFKNDTIRLNNLLNQSARYKAGVHSRTNTPFEYIASPYDSEIDGLQASLKQQDNNYKINQENPYTANYKQKVKGLWDGNIFSDESLVNKFLNFGKKKDDIPIPDIQAEIEAAANQKPIEKTEPSQEPSISNIPGENEPNPYYNTSVLDQNTQKLKEKSGLPGPLDTFPEGNPNYPNVNEPEKPFTGQQIVGDNGEVQNQSVLDQVSSKLQDKMANGLDQTGGFTGQAGQGINKLVEAEKQASQDYLGDVAPGPLASLAKTESDLMADYIKKFKAIKNPRLNFKQEEFKAPKDELLEPEKRIWRLNNLDLAAAGFKDWGRFYQTGHWGTGDSEVRKRAKEEIEALNEFKSKQRQRQKDLDTKNTGEKHNAWDLYKYKETQRFNMAKENQDAAEKENNLKMKLLDMEFKKKGKGATDEFAKRIGDTFTKNPIVKDYTGKIGAFKNIMKAPPGGAGDKDIIENLVKFVDPGMAIRKSKVDFIVESLPELTKNPDGSYSPAAYERWKQRLTQGGHFSADDRKLMKEAVVNMMRNSVGAYLKLYNQNHKILSDRGLDTGWLFPQELAVQDQAAYEAALNSIRREWIEAQKSNEQFDQNREKLIDKGPISL
jgi:hypothetical protein